MARTALSVIDVPVAGTNPRPTAANADGHSVTWSRDIALVAHNGDASSKTITIDVPGTVNGLTITDRPITLAAGTSQIVPLGCAEYRQADGVVHIDYSAVTQVTVGVVRLPSL